LKTTCHRRADRPGDVVLEEAEAWIRLEVPDVLPHAGIEVVEPDNLDAVAAKTIAEVGPQESSGARDEGSHYL
jgi:hypothetical protein